jgi:hypothetical protein
MGFRILPVRDALYVSEQVQFAASIDGRPASPV